jgi:hypothetical protein
VKRENIKSDLTLAVGVGVFIQSPPSVIREITPLLQIRQVAHLMEHDMQPARMKPHAKEHTNNPVKRPHFRGQGTKKETPKADHHSPRS